MTQQKSVVFIEPSGSSGSNVFSDFMRLPLTGTLYLGTILHDHGYHVTILNECLLPEKIDPFTVRADVYCISSLTVSANRAKNLAGQFRRIYPESKILIGGIHASLQPEEFVDVADHVVVGEAEEIIVDLVEGKFTEKIVRGTAVSDVNTLPMLNYSLLQGHESMGIIPMMTSRGCPFDCNFCTVTKVFGKRFRMQSPERVIAEVKNALTYFRTKSIFFYDDNFTANRERVVKICDLLVKEKLDIAWSTQVRSDVANHPELLGDMARAGCRWFYVGFESIDDATLKAYHKSQTRSDIEKAIDAIHAAGINIHGMFIFGEDNDTVETLHRNTEFAIQHDIDTVQFMILTPFPGTQLYEKLSREKRIFHSRWDHFNGMYTVYQPKNMSASRLQRETVAAYRKFYSLRRLSLDLLDLGFNVVLDALQWDFRRAFRYGFDLLFLKSGASFLVKRFEREHATYLHFLENLEASQGNPAPPQ